MRKDLILKLAAHLDSKPPETFRFACFTAVPSKITEGEIVTELPCGSLCCAIGYLPRVFPDSFYWIGNPIGDAEIRLRNSNKSDFSASSEFFGISIDDSVDLFSPDPPAVYCHESPRFFGGPWCRSDATPAMVADRIRAFIAWKEAQE